ncbi:MAG: dihydroorotase [Lentisphaeria bacterium]|nr:dihydroorotase [Lentisphaeria bacterium]
MMKKQNNWILSGARVIDPVNNIDEVRKVYIKDGIIVDEAAMQGVDAEELDLTGKVVAPGFIDVHVHLRQPGKVDAETVRTGTQAAAAGGFTTVVAMPNTSPVTDNAAQVQYIRELAERDGIVHVLPCGALSKGLAGEEMAPIGSLASVGVAALSDDGKCVQNHELMRHIVEYASNFDLPIMDHCENTALAAGGVMHEGYWSVLLGMKGQPSAAEELMISRNIMLARMTGCRIHMQHVSARESVALLRYARANGIPVTGEATPHHIALTDVEIKRFDTNYKMNPPLRSEDDRMAVIEGLQDGTLTIIATDHAPHTQTAKQVEFDYAPFGIIGLETAVPVTMTELVHKGYLTLPQLISKFTKGPAELLKRPIGSLSLGSAADVTVIDPDVEHTIDISTFYSKSRNTPFDGYQAKGRTAATFVDGVCVYSRLDEDR